jgi:hypothetical protein
MQKGHPNDVSVGLCNRYDDNGNYSDFDKNDDDDDNDNVVHAKEKQEEVSGYSHVNDKLTFDHRSSNILCDLHAERPYAIRIVGQSSRGSAHHPGQHSCNLTNPLWRARGSNFWCVPLNAVRDVKGLIEQTSAACRGLALSLARSS